MMRGCNNLPFATLFSSPETDEAHVMHKQRRLSTYHFVFAPTVLQFWTWEWSFAQQRNCLIEEIAMQYEFHTLHALFSPLHS